MRKVIHPDFSQVFVEGTKKEKNKEVQFVGKQHFVWQQMSINR